MFSLTAIFINVLVAAMEVPDSYDETINTILVVLNVFVILIIAGRGLLPCSFDERKTYINLKRVVTVYHSNS